MNQKQMASLGGKARAKKYTKAQLSAMGKKGGRPKVTPPLYQHVDSGVDLSGKENIMENMDKKQCPMSGRMSQCASTETCFHLKKQKKQSFKEYLQVIHADQYHGTDDDMPDDYDQWEMEMDTSEMITFAQRWGDNMSVI